MVTRDSKNTKAKLLNAAMHAFVDQGFAGARVDVIAASAGVNKRMLYHHFGDKRGLYQAVLAEISGARDQLSASQARLLAWEGLAESAPKTDIESDDNALQQNPSAGIESLAEPASGADLDAQMFQLLQTALQVFPHVCGPEVVRLTGLEPGSEAFEAALAQLQARVARRMDPKTRATKTRATKTKVTLRARSRPKSAG